MSPTACRIETSRSVANGRRRTKSPQKKPGSLRNLPIPNIADRNINNNDDAPSRSAVALSTGLHKESNLLDLVQ